MVVVGGAMVVGARVVKIVDGEGIGVVAVGNSSKVFKNLQKHCENVINCEKVISFYCLCKLKK